MYLTTNPQTWGTFANFLWSITFPGIYKSFEKRLSIPDDIFRSNPGDYPSEDTSKPASLKFANFVSTNGFSVNALFHNLSPNRRRGSHKEVKTKHKLRYHRSMIKDGKRYSFFDMTEVRPLRPVPANQDPQEYHFQYPGRKNNGFTGIVPVEHAITHCALRGVGECEKIINSHILISIDPGVINTAGSVVAAVNIKRDPKKGTVGMEGEFVRTKLKTTRFYESTTDSYTKEQNIEMKAFSDDITHLSEYHARTSDIDKLTRYADTYLEKSDPIRLHNREPEVLRQKRKSDSKKQQFWANYVNELLAQVDALRKRYPEKNRTPIILFGDGKFKSTKGHRGAPARFLMRYLARFFPVFVVREPYSSQNCPKCLVTKLLEMDMEGTRHWYCPKSDCRSINKKDGTKYDKFIVHKDISAPMNFITIFVTVLLTGKRPTAFCIPSSS